MDQTKCPHCGKRLKPVMSLDQRTELRCLFCDNVDPVQTDAKLWAQSSLANPLPRKSLDRTGPQ
jgi:hypothetical protein